MIMLISLIVFFNSVKFIFDTFYLNFSLPK